MLFTNKPKRALIILMSALTLLAVVIAFFHYRNDNSSVDPRVIEARKLYSKYDQYTEYNNYEAIFGLLDSIEDNYKAIDYYKDSYEIGVLHNNRAAAFLSMAIRYEDNSISLDGVTILSKDTLLVLSEIESRKSVAIYSSWIKQFEDKTEQEITHLIGAKFLKGLENYTEKDKQKFLSKHVKEIIKSKTETPRRLSVAYTNLGIALRHKNNYEKAIECYLRALELWNRNLAAENSLNSLLGKPQRKLNVFEKLFPPDKLN
jgi:tetratricopeptide (TPR) repeat protein